MSAQLLDFCLYGMNKQSITYIYNNGEAHFTININDKDIMSIAKYLDIKASFVVFGAISSMVTRNVTSTKMILR